MSLLMPSTADRTSNDNDKSGRHRWELTSVMIATCIGVFAVTELLHILGLVSRHQMFTFLGLSYNGVFHRIWLHQLITSPLLHGSIVHLAFNMLALWMLGIEVERTLGKGRYIILSMVSSLFGSMAFLFADWGGITVGMGYSAVIFGLLVVYAQIRPETDILVFFFFRMKVKYAVLLMGLIEIYFCATVQGGAANAAHIFGAVGAGIYLLAARRCQRYGKKKPIQPARAVMHRRSKRNNVPTEL